MRPHRRSGAGRNPERVPCVYLLASRRNGTLYVGVTSALIRRVWEHKNDLAAGFTKRYQVHTLVWYEVHDTIGERYLAGKCHHGMEAGLEDWVDREVE